MLMPRGMGWAGEGASQSGCPSGQWNSNLQTCCAPGDGTVPAMDDPCSLFNQQPYLQEQATVQAQAIAGDAGTQSATLAAIENYSQPVQTAALNCVSNPGLKYTDNWGNPVTCPSQSVNDNGIMVSAFTAEQLAAMIQPVYATAPLPADAYAGTTVVPPAGTVPAAAIQAVAPAPPKTTTTTGSGSPAGSTNAGGSNSTSTSTSSSGVDLSFLTDDSLISGIPNWGVAFGALAALMILPGIINSMGRR